MTELRTDRLKRQISDDSDPIAKRRKHVAPELQSFGLAHLPEEVLLVILDVVLGKLVRCSTLADALQHVKTLHSLCLTNSTLSRLATPYLSAFISNRNRRKVPQALDAMILDPKKAEGIKYMSWALDVKRSSQAMCRRSPRAETVFLQKLGRLGIPELAGDLRQCFHGNSPEYHLATALVLAPNVEYLEAADVNYEQETPGGIIWRPTWLELLSLKALSSPPGLSQHFEFLRHLRIDMGELSFDQIAPLLRLPALQILHFVGGQHSGGIRADTWNEEVGERHSTIQILLFEYCSVSSKIVARIADAIKQLKVLKLEVNDWLAAANEDLDNHDTRQLSWPILNTAIAKHKESLERLYLLQGNTSSWTLDEGELDIVAIGQNRLECLVDMHKLRYLDTDFKFIQTTPSWILHSASISSIEHLVIQAEEERGDSMNCFQRALEDLATHCRSRLPVLRDILVWLPQAYYDKSTLFDLDFTTCKVAFEGQGVGLIILVYVREQKRWQLHPSTVEEHSMLASDSWCFELDSTSCDLRSQDGRARVVLHGPCNTYHHPDGWSIIDDFALTHR